MVSAVLEKITLLSTSSNSTFSCQSSKVQNTFSESTSKNVSNILPAKSETENLNKSAIMEKIDEGIISGGGDASLVMKTCQKLNSIRLANNKIQK